MPPVLLGAITFISFLVALIFHRPLERVLVDAAFIAFQPRRQFYLDFGLVLAAGLGAGLYNRIAFHIKLFHGFAFFAGFVAFGFFIALDMALARERHIIGTALNEDITLPPSDRFYPLTRRFLLVTMVTAVLVLILISLVISRDMVWLTRIAQDGIPASHALFVVTGELTFIFLILLVMILNLLFSYARNLKLLFETETGILEQVSRGDLSRLVPVATYDEFGTIAGYTNIMIRALRHRIQIISALKVAEEIQQNLLPKAPPEIAGLDIAGTSIYCDEVGGDYYDYLELPGNRLGIVVTDASGHGVGSALHMTTIRAFLRFGARNYRGPARLLRNVNRFMTEDNGESGRFTTLFFLEIDLSERRLRWVRAGHDPAILYNPRMDRFEELHGDGMALGVTEEYVFPENVREGWPFGSIVLISTDGIREARNESDEMFGTERLQAVVRRYADVPAADMLDAIIGELRRFQGDVPQEDDLTLVVVKHLPDSL